MKAYKEITKNTYNSRADEISARFASYFSIYREPVIGKFLKFLPDSDEFSILDIGCGSGDAAAYVSERLANKFKKLNLIGIDISAGMLRKAKEKGVTTLQMDIEHLAFVPESFDACWAMNSLLHLPKSNVPKVINQIVNILKPRGTLFVSMKKGEGEGFVEAPELEQRFYSFWQKDEFLDLTEDFELLDFDETKRADNTFLNFYLKKLAVHDKSQ